MPDHGTNVRAKGCFGSIPAVRLRTSESPLVGATRTFCKVRYPVAMGWQGDLEEAVLNKLN